jgi:translation initiation factor IF-2
VKRDKETIAEVEATQLRRGAVETKEVFEGDLCGVSLSTTSKLEVKEGDHLEFFSRKTVEREL